MNEGIFAPTERLRRSTGTGKHTGVLRRVRVPRIILVKGKARFVELSMVTDYPV